MNLLKWTGIGYVILIIIIIIIITIFGISEMVDNSKPNQSITQKVNTPSNNINDKSAMHKIIIPPKTEEEAIEFIVDNIKNQKYEDAWFYTRDFKSKNCKTLNIYAYILSLNKEKDFYMRNLNIKLDLDPNYDGPMFSEIKNFALQFSDIGKDFQGKTVYIISKIKTKVELDARVIPKIGITSTQTYNSTWGYPDDINKTITKDNVSEQWIYKKNNKFDFKYIYLDDGIVTAIQE